MEHSFHGERPPPLSRAAARRVQIKPILDLKLIVYFKWASWSTPSRASGPAPVPCGRATRVNQVNSLFEVDYVFQVRLMEHSLRGERPRPCPVRRRDACASVGNRGEGFR